MTEKTIFRLPRALKPHRNKTLVRIGNQFDGGYILAADAVASMQNILTFGLGLDWSFEKSMVEIGRASCRERV